MKTKISSLYESIYQDQSTKDPHEFISLIEPNISTIEGFDKGDQNEYKMATRLICDYSLMVFKTGAHVRSIPWLNKAINLLKNDTDLAEKDLFSEPMYEALIASRGVSQYSYRRLKRAQDDFEQLLSVFPENKEYVQWLRKVVRKRYQRLAFPFNLLIATGIAMYLLLMEAKGFLVYLEMGLIFLGLVGSVFLAFRKRKELKTLPNTKQTSYG